MPTALVVQGSGERLLQLAQTCRSRGFRMQTARGIPAVRAALCRQPPDVILVDGAIPEEQASLLPVLASPLRLDVVLVGEGDRVACTPDRVAAAPAGPETAAVDPAQLGDRLDALAERLTAIGDEGRRPGAAGSPSTMIGRSRPIRKRTCLMSGTAASAAPVLITGERGTGRQRATARIIAATPREPADAVAHGLLREDLQRLLEIPLHLPPLRPRGDDVRLLAGHFLRQRNLATGRYKRFCDETLAALMLHDWHGNVRELQDAVRRAHEGAGTAITPADLPGILPCRLAAGEDALQLPVGCSLAEARRRYVISTWVCYEGDEQRAARVLGIAPRTLQETLKNGARAASPQGPATAGPARSRAEAE